MASSSASSFDQSRGQCLMSLLTRCKKCSAINNQLNFLFNVSLLRKMQLIVLVAVVADDCKVQDSMMLHSMIFLIQLWKITKFLSMPLWCNEGKFAYLGILGWYTCSLFNIWYFNKIDEIRITLSKALNF